MRKSDTTLPLIYRDLVRETGHIHRAARRSTGCRDARDGTDGDGEHDVDGVGRNSLA